jgi:hypothetical protein
MSALMPAGRASAQTPPVIDGNLDDMIAYANAITRGCGLTTNDPAMDIQIFDPQIIPCVPVVNNYFANGFDMVLVVVAYDVVNDQTYLGIRTAGVIGDTDGNGDPNTTCATSTIPDEPGIGGSENYAWWFDLDLDNSADLTVSVSNNVVNVSPPAGAMSFAYNGTDLEVQVSGLGLPAAWRTRSFANSTFDGLAEDATAGFTAPTHGDCAPTPAQASSWGRVKAGYR